MQSLKSKISYFCLGDVSSYKKRLAAKTTRLFKKLKTHKMIAKIPHSRRWKVTEKGWSVLGSAVCIYDIGWQHVMHNKTA